MEELKSFSDLMEPDIRQRLFMVREQGNINFRPIEAKDIFERAEQASLHCGVPEDVRSQFAMAQNLLAYSWFYYPFNVAAELHGYISVELALKRRYPQKRGSSFHDLLNQAVTDGLLTSDGFFYGRRQQEHQLNQRLKSPADIEELRDYVKEIAFAMRTLRNSLAHGTPTLHMKGGTVLLVCSELINQLFTQT